MITDTQKGMMYHHMTMQVATLIEYFINRLGGDSYDVVNFINEAYDEAQEIIISDQTSDKPPLPPLVRYIPVIKQELRGMLNPNMEILNELKIINGPRKEMEVDSKKFNVMYDELKECAASIFERTIKRNHQLKNHIKDFDVLRENSTNSLTI